MAVKVLKLSTGEEVMGDLQDNPEGEVIVSDGKITIEKPAKIMLIPTKDGGIGIALMTWTPYSDDKEISIGQEFVVTTLNPAGDLLKEYRERFGSGIITPSKNIVT